MAFAPSVPTEDSPSQAFLSNNNDEDSDFSALDSMTPHSYNAGHHYSQQQQQPSQHFGAVVPHSLYNNQGASANYRISGASVDGSMNSGSTGDNNIGRVGDGVNGGFAGVSESLFDRIRARAEQQQKPQQSSYSSSASQSPHQQHQPQTQQQVKSAFVSQQQQQQQQPTLEYEGDSSVGGAVANNHHGNDPNPSTNQATYAFSPPPSELPSQISQQYSQQQPQQPPRVPTYGPSRNDPHYSSLAHHGHGHGGSTTSLQDKAAMAWENTSSALKSLWGKASSGAQTIGALAREARAGNGGTGGMRGGGGGYNNNFLLRSEIDDDDDDEMERGVGRGPNASQLHHHQQQQIPGAATDTMMTGSNASGVGSGAIGGDQSYSMVTYAKTFCLDVFGFVRDMPLWGKGFFLLLLLWALYAFKG